MSDQPYLILHTHLTAEELRPHMSPRDALPAYIIATLRARGFRVRSLDDYEGTLQGQVDRTTQGLWVRQILPRKEATDDTQRPCGGSAARVGQAADHRPLTLETILDAYL